jgi:hypothetical protein
VDFINPNKPQYDLIMAIRALVGETHWKLHWRHVKGHQDELQMINELDNWSRWNIQMDAKAKKFWQTTKHQKIHPPIEGEPWQTIVAGEKITSQLCPFLWCNIQRNKSV